MPRPSLLISAGEASGDLHGAHLVSALREFFPDASFFGVGGRRMRARGVEIYSDLSSIASVGIVEGLPTYFRIARVFFAFAKEACRRKPDLAILIDFPEFNMRLVPRLARAGVPVVYYITPQVWAWRTHRVNRLRRFVDLALVVLPFEERFLRRHGVDARFVGHPLLDILPPRAALPNLKETLGVGDRPLIALLPGSRTKEFERHLMILKKTAPIIRRYVDCAFCVGVAPSISASSVRDCPFPTTDDTHALLASADAAVVASGTATLEAAIYRVPMVVIYRVATFSFTLLGHLVRSRWISLANIIAGREVVPEMVQRRATPQKIARQTLRLLDPAVRAATMMRMDSVCAQLGGRGAVRRAASHIAGLLEARA